MLPFRQCCFTILYFILSIVFATGSEQLNSVSEGLVSSVKTSETCPNYKITDGQDPNVCISEDIICEEYRYNRWIPRKTVCKESLNLPCGINRETFDSMDTPQEFNPLTNPSIWESCPSVRTISDQGPCSSCWAVVAADVMTDRLCIRRSQNNTKVNIQTDPYRFSAINLLTCCDSCRVNRSAPCSEGGKQLKAWEHWVTKGVASGGYHDPPTITKKDMESNCQNYHKHVMRCDHTNYSAPVTANSNHPETCSSIDAKVIEDMDKNLACQKECEGKDVQYASQVRKGKMCYTLDRTKDGEVDEKLTRLIKAEIMTNGPVQGHMYTHKRLLRPQEFMTDRGSVYKKKITDEMSEGHSIRIIGWGENDKGEKYWVVANSWGEYWGNMRGFFYLDLNYEGVQEVFAGIPADDD